MTPARRLPGQRRAPHRVHHHSEFARQGSALEANLLLQFQLRSALSERTRVSITVAAS